MTLDASKQFDPGYFGNMPNARRILDPYLQIFGSVPLQAWRTYQQSYSHVHAIHDDTSTANIIHVHMIDFALQLFSSIENVKYINPGRKQHFFIVNGNVLVRFKKLSLALYSSNIPTHIQRKLLGGELDLFNDKRLEHLVTIGYVPNRAWTNHNGLYAVERLNDQLVWFSRFNESLDIDNVYGTINLFVGPDNRVEEPILRLRNLDEKRNDEDQGQS